MNTGNSLRNLPVNPKTAYPVPGQAKVSSLEEGIQNFVIENPRYEILLEENLVTEAYEYKLCLYDSELRRAEKPELKDKEDLAQILKREDSKVIRIYERGKSGQLLAEPSLSIFKDLKIAGDKKLTYVVFNLYGKNEFRYEDRTIATADEFDTDLIFASVNYILKKRFWDEFLDKIKKGGRMPVLPQKPMIKVI